jgi:hypothetical protein
MHEILIIFKGIILALLQIFFQPFESKLTIVPSPVLIISFIFESPLLLFIIAVGEVVDTSKEALIGSPNALRLHRNPSSPFMYT